MTIDSLYCILDVLSREISRLTDERDKAYNYSDPVYYELNQQLAKIEIAKSEFEKHQW